MSKVQDAFWISAQLQDVLTNDTRSEEKREVFRQRLQANLDEVIQSMSPEERNSWLVYEVMSA